MKRLASLGLGVATGAAFAIAPTAVTPAATVDVVNVRVGDNFFKPKRLAVDRGTVVRWRFRGDLPHNVTVTSGPARFRSETKSSGAYRKRLAKRGTYAVVCTLHAGMTQRIAVR